MILSEISIKRPVFATVVNILLILLGIVGLMRLSVREYPKIDLPVVSITTTYTGASPEIMETQVTKIIEDAVSGIEGINFMNSTSQRERSVINITFNASRDLEQAANDVRDRVSRAKRSLPDEVSEPVIQKSDADADAIITLSLTSDQHTPVEMTKVADKIIKAQLELLDGVATINLWGARFPEMRIWLDPQKMAAFGLTYAEIEAALRKQNIEIPSGTIKSTSREFSIVSRTDLNTTDQFESIILKRSDTNNYLVRLSDVANIQLSSGDESSRPRMNGKTAIGIGVVKQSTANPLSLSQEVNALLPSLISNLPEGMNLQVSVDTSVFIDHSLKSVYQTIIEAMLFVGFVIFLFLRDWRATLIPIITVPIALIGTLFFMYILGYSINTLTLLAFVLAIGLVVDDAIVMLENIHRHIEAGLSPMEAALVGSKEIGFAIIAMTITLAAVFLPLTFSEGRIGLLFIEFAVTLSIAVLISGFTALTLSPMMCARLIKPHKKHGFFFNSIESLLNYITIKYKNIISTILNFKKLIGFVIFIIFAGIMGVVGLFMQIKSELTPLEDRGMIRISAAGPEGSTINFVDRYFSEIETMIRKELPDVTNIFSVVGIGGGGSAFASIVLKDWSLRTTPQKDMTQKINRALPKVGVGLKSMAINPASLGQGGNVKPVEVVLRSNANYATLAKQLDEIMLKINSNPNLEGADHDLRLNTPQLEVAVDREKLALLGIDVDIVGRTLETALGGRQVTRYKEGADQYDVIIKIDDTQRQKPQDLEGLYVRASTGNMIPLANLVTVSETIAPQALKHFDKLRAITITAGLNPKNISQGEAIAFVENSIKEIVPDALIDYTGSAREFKETGAAIYWIFSLALIFIYLVLAAQFESWRDPFIIIITVPLALLGALIALFLTNNSLNIYSQIGLITLIGLITKHGILIVEFANQLQASGLEKTQAIIQSASLRLRPILMTTAAMVLGALPLALAKGAGAESRQAIGWVIVGGMSLGTVLTLLVVPVVYLIIAKNKPAS